MWGYSCHVIELTRHIAKGDAMAEDGTSIEEVAMYDMLCSHLGQPNGEKTKEFSMHQWPKLSKKAWHARAAEDERWRLR